jgi:chromate transporter
MKDFFELIWTFIKIGATTFGGGYAMVPVLERELINRRGWITMEEVMDYYTIAQITPGLIAVNVSTFVGYKRRGIAGGAAATVAFILPGVCLMTVIALGISRFAEYPAVQYAFAGIRAAVGALVLDTVWKMFAALFKAENAEASRRAGALIPGCIAALAFALSALLSASPALIILGAGAAGFLLWRLPKRLQKQADAGDKP